MRTLIYLFIISVFFAKHSFAQKNTVDTYFLLKPTQIKPTKSGPVKYEVSLKWQNLDAINGNKINCNAVKATYIAGLENDSVSWKDVSLSQINDFRQSQFNGINLPAFNNFTYKVDEANFLTEDFYKNIPQEQKDLAKWLVSDAVQMQGLAWYIFDSLEFNKVFIPKFLENYDIKFKDWVTFSSRYQKLIWSGITKYNNEVCAIVKFESLYNPVSIENAELSVKGRSLYYGEIWISLKDKQVEYATMVEDVIMKLKGPSFPQEQLFDLQREVVFKKVNNN
jgi:hypothetical protein